MKPSSAVPRASRSHHGGAAASAVRERLALDPAGIEAARSDLHDGAVTPHFGPWREEIIGLLNDALATQWICAMRYRRHHFTATGLGAAAIAGAFLVHADAEARHADQLARRIVELGGEPDLNPDTLSQRSHASYSPVRELQAMLRANLIAERVTIEACSQMVALIGSKDPTTRCLLESILAQEQRHARALADWLVPA
ncbi:ferritin-like domain-containing protein [Comamonas endophytica]|uniref:Ferritin-like domain-containing protein n=1 Tax=Comamonas endophytica TaxID=2949090 RepID=A0ABY6G5T2_9BURK|nr:MULTISPECIES: ferritin-like domain-containing protein [unclassified Acidovorax]MCD2512287.1 ferritin-like domain-containing protein [Acidovorax sp. D4N7]UYG50256.1 ferritin-like domain-containing protein [Acidovorax sp. 5MLIR]